MVVLVHKCVQQTHLLALHLETLGYIPRLLNPKSKGGGGGALVSEKLALFIGVHWNISDFSFVQNKDYHY